MKNWESCSRDDSGDLNGDISSTSATVSMVGEEFASEFLDRASEMTNLSLPNFTSRVPDSKVSTKNLSTGYPIRRSKS